MIRRSTAHDGWAIPHPGEMTNTAHLSRMAQPLPHPGSAGRCAVKASCQSARPPPRGIFEQGCPHGGKHYNGRDKQQPSRPRDPLIGTRMSKRRSAVGATQEASLPAQEKTLPVPCQAQDQRATGNRYPLPSTKPAPQPAPCTVRCFGTRARSSCRGRAAPRVWRCATGPQPPLAPSSWTTK